MDVVLIYNGLGNQMSQYALYYRKKRAGQNVRYICLNTAHNGIELEPLFGINTKMKGLDKVLIVLYHIISTDKYPFLFVPLQKLLNLFKVSVLRENGDYSFREDVVRPNPRGIRFLSGGWHNSEYFKCVQEDIKKIYTFPEITDHGNLDIINKMINVDSVAIHIRRGDYLQGDNYKKYGSVCTLNYYKNAIELVERITTSPKFFIFSNDKDYSSALFEGKDVTYVDINLGKDSWKDILLMGQCKFLIIANSTFSWWAGWLSGYSERIFCPPFFVNGDKKSDIYLSDWIRVSN